jgi:hypothetical protein
MVAPELEAVLVTPGATEAALATMDVDMALVRFKEVGALTTADARAFPV